MTWTVDIASNREGDGRDDLAGAPPFWQLEALIDAGMDAPSALAVLALRREASAAPSPARRIDCDLRVAGMSGVSRRSRFAIRFPPSSRFSDNHWQNRVAVDRRV